jgi:tubulin monoglycylase TTLL3/8
MIDTDFQLKMIEVNTNPCLEISCPLMARILPSIFESGFKIAVDPFY